MNVAAGAPLFTWSILPLCTSLGRSQNHSFHARGWPDRREIEVPNTTTMLPAGKLVSVGQVLNPQSRTLPITFAADNRTLGLAVGQSVFLHLLLDQTAQAPVIRESAIVDDAGRPVVFVQLAGEAFARRPVTLDNRQGDYVQIASGVKAGERVVTKGAYLIRLAAMSSSIPAHGHVH